MLLGADTTDVWIDLAKQAPALVLYVFSAGWVLKYLSSEKKATEERIIAGKAVVEKMLMDVLERAEKNTATLSNVVETNSKVLGGITVLLTLVENDLKNGRK